MHTVDTKENTIVAFPRSWHSHVFARMPINFEHPCAHNRISVTNLTEATSIALSFCFRIGYFAYEITKNSGGLCYSTTLWIACFGGTHNGATLNGQKQPNIASNPAFNKRNKTFKHYCCYC